MKKLALLLSAVLLSVPSFAEIRLPAIIGDHMVLQQKSDVKLWGWADPGKTVSVSCSWDGKSYSTRSDSQGAWLLRVKTPSAGGPYEITISDGKKLRLSDILIGEVWLCSGQSNMELPLGGIEYGQFVEGGQDYIAEADPSRPIRMAQLAVDYSTAPKDDCNVTWQVNDPAVLPKISACAAFFGDILQRSLGVPVGLIITNWGASTMETWMDKETLLEVRPGMDFSILDNEDNYKGFPQQAPTLLYNAMVNPLRNCTVKGLIWYQGESNISNFEDYAALQKAFIGLWRKTFDNPEMTFCYTQIAPFEYPYPENEKKAAFLREQQALGESQIDNASMAVTIDVGQKYVIHPNRKKEVSKRLAWGALALAYGRRIEYRSPSYLSHEIDGSRILITVSHADNGLHCSLPQGEPIPGFEVAGADKRFHPAQASLLHRPERIAVSSPDVPAPVSVRYCFKDYQPGYLYNNFCLPLAPFRTDCWPDAKGPVFWW